MLRCFGAGNTVVSLTWPPMARQLLQRASVQIWLLHDKAGKRSIMVNDGGAAIIAKLGKHRIGVVSQFEF